MKKVRSLVRVISIILMLVILGIVGYNIALRYNYPEKYTDIVEKYAKEYGVNATLVMAVARSESSFNENAVSSAGAKGLMQLTEETFYDVRKMVGDGEEITFENSWNDPEINIKYGTKYLAYLLDRFDGDCVTALAAYNAGPGNVNKWVGEDEKLQPSEIRFSETAEYVEKVLEAQDYYKKLYFKGE